MAEDDVFVEDVVRKHHLDRTAVALAAVHLDDVEDDRRSAECGIVVFRKGDIAHVRQRGVVGIEETRIGEEC